MFIDRTFNNSLRTTFVITKKLNGTTNLTQQDIQKSSLVVMEEIVQTIPTTKQQIILCIHQQKQQLTSKRKLLSINNITFNI